ncbi:MAG: hypothetical protein FVQ81_06590 [Candidatus Glassbacteria bacterium]|nr:hypothetical protein [Candidatus Glassbacteria bacterium]
MYLTGTVQVLFSPLLTGVFLTAVLACSYSGSEDPSIDDLRSFAVPPGNWAQDGIDVFYGPANLHEYVNGGAERYLGYGFSGLYIADFTNSSKQGTLRVEIYLMDNPANAYGIFSSDRSGRDPGGIGSDADLGDYLLQFWQGPCFVRVQDIDLSGGLGEELAQFGRKIGAAIPFPAGEGRPRLLKALPSEGVVEESICYFHTHISLNSFVYLGDSNPLNLGMQTGAVTAEYALGRSSRKYCRLVLVRYPSPDDARKAARAVKLSPEAQSAGLVDISTAGNHLLTVFGDAPADWFNRIKLEIADTLSRFQEE